LAIGSTVRIELRLGSAAAGPACNSGVSLAGGCIGYFDAQVRKGKRGVLPSGLLSVQRSRNLPIRIHIAEGALDEDSGPPDHEPITSLNGAPDSSAAAAIPDMDFEFEPDDYTADLDGTMVTFNKLYLAFNQETTVAQANALLDEIDAEIIGGVPGKPGQAAGLLYLRVPTQSHAEMDALLDALNADPRVLVAVEDSLFESLESPAPVADVVGWTWETKPSGGNWGMEAIRAPQLWNLNEAVKKAHGSTATGVLDVGFARHYDLAYAVMLDSPAPPDQAKHGTHVSGTIAATYGNGRGVDGVNPFADLVAKEWGPSMPGLGLYEFVKSTPGLRVVNLSIGNRWSNVGIDPALSERTQRRIARQARVFEAWGVSLAASGTTVPLLVAAAGNDSGKQSLNFVDVDAKWTSPWNYAASVYGNQNVIVVEAVGDDPTDGLNLAGFSDINGTVSAPGVNILSTGPSSDFVSLQGTSMAAPHVTGLVSYLLSLDPTLTPAELSGLLRNNGRSVPRSSPFVDAFASALAIDGLRNNSAVLKRLLDIDDGTVDGNLRLDCTSSCASFTDEDADGDGGTGDGAIDMSDFRRWRDWHLQAMAYPDLALDGSELNMKQDVNKNGLLESSDNENIYPRGDFNGDGTLDLTKSNFVPGYINASVSDLEALQALFEDPDYSASDLDDLVESADLHVDPTGCMGDGVTRVETKIFETADMYWVDGRIDTEPESHEYTMPLRAGGYTVRVLALNANGVAVGVAQASVDALLGSDSWFAPKSCGLISLSPDKLQATLNQGDSTTETVHLTSSGPEVTWEFANAVENVETSMTDGTLTTGEDVEIEVTITCPATAGSYGGLLNLTFRDSAGHTIDEGVPEYLIVDLLCIDGGVTLDPATISKTLPVGESIKEKFYLTNKGTALKYEAVPGPSLAIEKDAKGVLPTRGRVDIELSMTCPETPGTYSSKVDLTFEREDGKPVTVPVPEKLRVELTCTDDIPVTMLKQYVSSGVRIIHPDHEKSEGYFSDDATGTAKLRHFERAGEPYTLIDTPVDPIGLGTASSSTSLSDTKEFIFCFGCPVEKTRTVTGNATTAYESSYEDRKFTLTGNFSHTYSQSIPLPGGLCCGADTVSGGVSLAWDLEESATLVATWSCGGRHYGAPTNVQRGYIGLTRLGAQSVVFQSDEDPNTPCTYQAQVPAGRYFLEASELLIQLVDLPNEQLTASKTSTFTLEFTFSERE